MADPEFLSIALPDAFQAPDVLVQAIPRFPESPADHVVRPFETLERIRVRAVKKVGDRVVVVLRRVALP
ncbi:hypothetical protein [Actinomadura sp. J1-007]|nr:hypothetical protein [Actinomadura sp. J1-007]